MIAITGIGVMSSLGMGKESLVQALRQGSIGIASPSKIHVKGVNALGEARDFEPKKYIPPLKARKMSRLSLLALSSAVEAMNDSGLKIGGDIGPFECAVIVGTSLASVETTDSFFDSLMQGGPLNTNPILFPETVQNVAASQIAINFGIKGPNTTFSQAETSAEAAMMYASSLIRKGKARAVIVTGVEELSEALVNGYSALGIMSKKNICAPYAEARDGFVPGEGAATLVLESPDSARARGAKVHALIKAVSIVSSPAERLSYDPTGRSLMRAMHSAMKDSGIEFPDAIFGAANSTVDLDSAEALAIREMFRGRKIPVAAVRAYTGFFPADGALRTAAAVLCMSGGFLPAMPGGHNAFDGADCLDFAPDAAFKSANPSVLVNSLSNGGSAACVAIRKADR